MKRATAILIGMLATFALGQGQPAKTIDLVFLVSNGFKGPIFVEQGRVVLPEVTARQKNTYSTVVVDDAGEAVQIGVYDKVSG